MTTDADAAGRDLPLDGTPAAGDDPYLFVDGTPVARYVLAPDLDARHGPRPFLHPVRTLAGAPVSDALPADHVWHLGASLAVQDVNGTNLWGGRTYVRDLGYTWRADHGRIVHTGWEHRSADRLDHRLHWCDPAGDVLLTERRTLTASRVPGPGGAWRLEVSSILTAPAHRDVVLGSPATNGRPGGAGYGGFFWRAVAAEPPEVFTASLDGEEAVNGCAEPWVAMTGRAPEGGAYTLVFSGLGPGDRWFVRTTMYPGVCVAFAFEQTTTIPADTSRHSHYRVVVADGRLDRRTAAILTQ
ncbi:oxidoreductase [Micromonospora sonchi]|uniref:Oxidoreductase n=1 Tax=Micromonospora sonchi TaxID=1763543 RepID=A0A917TVB2_9ACTN|nr:PmoA family protein [Micromonospora sonchi]GGM39322.1 oxidoreductase [Micromonospora sonchi]